MYKKQCTIPCNFNLFNTLIINTLTKNLTPDKSPKRKKNTVLGIYRLDISPKLKRENE